MCDWPKGRSMAGTRDAPPRLVSRGGARAKLTLTALALARVEWRRGEAKEDRPTGERRWAADAWSWLLTKRLAGGGVRLFSAG
jgi:hypothetical protein